MSTGLLVKLSLGDPSERKTAIAGLQGLLQRMDRERSRLAQNLEFINWIPQALTDCLEPDIEPILPDLLCNISAEIAKTNEGRESLCFAGAIPILLKVIEAKRSVDDVSIQCLRSLANLCFDNEGARDEVYEVASSTPVLLSCLKTQNEKLAMVACGALYNISMDHDPIQSDMLKHGALHLLLEFMKPLQENLLDRAVLNRAYEAAKVFGNIVEASADAKIDPDILRQVVKFVGQIYSKIQHEDVSELLYRLIDELVADIEFLSHNASVQQVLMENELLSVLLDLVDHKVCYASEHMEAGDAVEKTINYQESRKSASRVVMSVTLNDDNIIPMVHRDDLIQRFKSWIVNGSGNDADDEITMSGALCIGNLARTDESCQLLLQKHDIMQTLVQLVAQQLKRLNSQLNGEILRSTIRILHAASGAIKNLSLNPENRDFIGSSGIIPKFNDMLKNDSIRSSQFPAMSSLRNLTSGKFYKNVYRIVSGKNCNTEDVLGLSVVYSVESPLTTVIRVALRAKGPDDTGLRQEAGRMVANCIKGAYMLKGSHECIYRIAKDWLKIIVDSKGIAPLIQIVTGALVYLSGSIMDKEVKDQHIKYEASADESSVFPVVQNEGIIALTLLCDVFPKCVVEIERYHRSLLPTLARILSDKMNMIEGSEVSLEDDNKEDLVTYPPEIQKNICTLLLFMLKHPESKFKDKFDLAFKALLRKIKQKELEKANELVPVSTAPLERMPFLNLSMEAYSDTELLKHFHTSQEMLDIPNTPTYVTLIDQLIALLK